jgi:type VI secretion system secreted protein VgrG
MSGSAKFWNLLGLSQHARCLSLRIVPAELPPLLPYELTLSEGLSSPYWADLTCLCETPDLPLADVVGYSASAEITGDGSESRVVCGLVTRAELLGSDGGLTAYRLRIEPALALLDQRRASRAFQDRSVPQIVEEILGEYRLNSLPFTESFRHESVLQREYPRRSYCVQYQESDLAFIHRLLTEEGISYRFSHQANEANTPPLHVLHLFDNEAGLDSSPALPLSYKGRQRLDAQPLDQWRDHARIAGAAAVLATYEYKSTTVRRVSERGALDQGAMGRQAAAVLEDFEPLSLYAATDSDYLERYALLRRQAREMEIRTCTGEGAVLGLLPGHLFELVDGPVFHALEDEENGNFVAIRHFLRVRNNLPADLDVTPFKAAPPPSPAWCKRFFPQVEDPPVLEGDRRYMARVTAIQQATPIVPPNAGRSQPRTAFGPQSAIVVGPHAGMVHTDELGRIKILFHWQRPPNRPIEEPLLGSPWSTWVRVATLNAGEGFGTQFLPRVGDEVVVEFLDGDMSRPVVVGSLYNGRRAPPRFSGQGNLPGNQALSGIRTQEQRGGNGYNELLFDDTPGQLRARLSSTDANSELNLGQLAQPRTDGRAAPRGQGAELRTRGHASVRAGRGVLLTTYDGEGPKADQLERQEATRLLAEGTEQSRALGAYARDHGAARCAVEPVQHLNDAFRHWNASDAATPVVATAAQGGLIDVTPASSVSYAGGSQQHTAREQIQLGAGQAVHIHAGTSIDLFAQSQGLRAIAHRDDLTLQAQAGNLNADARQNITLRTQDGGIVLNGKTLRLVAADGSYIEIGNGITLGTNGDVRIRSANFDQDGPATAAPTPPSFTQAKADQRVVLHFPHRDDDAVDPSTWIVADHHPYTITMADGSKVEGTTDAKGLTRILERDAPQIAQIVIHERDPEAGDGNG